MITTNKSIQRIEAILQYYTQALGGHYNTYRNHVYRVYYLTLQLVETDITSEEMESLAVGAAFHDLGVWTHHTMNYLTPSVEMATTYMDENNIGKIGVVDLLIEQHHKLGHYKGTHEHLVEPFRQADLVDLSFGLICFGLPATLYNELKDEFPYLGFHSLIYAKVMAYAVKHIWNPFPMMKV